VIRRTGLIALVLALACAPSAEDAASDAAAPGSAEAVAARLRLAGRPLDPPLSRPDFVLTDTRGRRFDFRAETAGRLTLLFFGYTSCPDICPVHLANLAQVLRKADPEVRRAVSVVFVGVDPRRDTPERVREFLDRFDEGFIGLTGSKEALRAAQLAAEVPPAAVDREWEGGYSVSHAGWILLVTPDDRAHLRYPFGVRQSEWAHDLDVLARRGWPGADPDAAPRVAVQDAVLTLPLDGTAALYATVVDTDGGGDRLVAVSAPRAGHAMLHRTTTEDGVARMRPVEGGIPVPEGGALRLVPGGPHVMLSGLPDALAPGDTLEVALVFEGAGAVPVRALVVSPEALADRADRVHAGHRAEAP